MHRRHGHFFEWFQVFFCVVGAYTLIRIMKTDKNNGLCTSAWGSAGWFFLHCVAAGYPVDPNEYDNTRGNARGHTSKAYASFFKNTGNVLPCRFCRESYLEYVAQLPIEKYLSSRQKLSEWLFIIHNKVNEKLGAPQETDLKRVVDKYERFRAKCHHPESLGCTEPANKNARMKCKVVVEPVHRNMKRRLSLLIILVAAVLALSYYRVVRVRG